MDLQGSQTNLAMTKNLECHDFKSSLAMIEILNISPLLEMDFIFTPYLRVEFL